MTQMKWIDLYNFLYERANDMDNLGSFPWQDPVEIFDFDSLQYYPTDFIQFPDKKISLSVDTSMKNAETTNGS